MIQCTYPKYVYRPNFILTCPCLVQVLSLVPPQYQVPKSVKEKICNDKELPCIIIGLTHTIVLTTSRMTTPVSDFQANGSKVYSFPLAPQPQK